MCFSARRGHRPAASPYMKKRPQSDDRGRCLPAEGYSTGTSWKKLLTSCWSIA